METKICRSEESISRKGTTNAKITEKVQVWWEVNSKMIKKVAEEVLGRTSGKTIPTDKETWNEEVQNTIKEKKKTKKN